MAGPQLMLAGQMALHAVATGQATLLRMIGMYLLVCASIGVAAFPKSPLPSAVVLALLLLVVPLAPQPQMR
jgi:hypothetical protein